MTEALVVTVIAVILLAWLIQRRLSQTPVDTFYDLSDGERKPHKWGYTDTVFEFDGPRSVRVTGSRYPLAGYSMPAFIPFAEEVLGVPITPEEMMPEPPPQVPPAPCDHAGFDAALREQLDDDQVSITDTDRLVHSHGQLSVDEIYRLLYLGALGRVVDRVLYPQSEDDVRHIVTTAAAHGVCLVPYGGGTNVSGALTLPQDEERVIASVDMRRMNHILSLDEENQQATVEAGISGKVLERELGALGFTSGHDPDSVELSTLGGWIATNASGMKKNRYGNIEDIVLEATLVTPAGDVETFHATPRNSTGVPPRVWLFGNEGNFGIITKATIKVHPSPEAREYGLLVFPQFDVGVRFLKQLRHEGGLPASIRLVNNNESRFGQALKSTPTAMKSLMGKVQKFVLYTLKGFDPLRMVACTIVMEGTRREVAQQKKIIFNLAKSYGGMSGGAHNGRNGYMLTFGIAYIRDFFNQFHIMGETFETSVPWNRIHQVTGAVEKQLHQQCKARSVRGTPYLAYRVTQTYHTGVCIYFTMGFSGKGLDQPDAVYHEIEAGLRQAILDNGGSLSHHHGIGKIRAGFLTQIQSEASLQVLRETKRAVDPDNIFGARNGPLADAAK
ncbi:MAG TPA: FAD-binding oxidoreductase [Candidatus Latescibacteria bacterium]|jgi:alkyldihydroxyacetonephosphate synthase|nr:FAD-binding oxidoreductase [Candidatus Latescibacterota bacterium]